MIIYKDIESGYAEKFLDGDYWEFAPSTGDSVGINIIDDNGFRVALIRTDSSKYVLQEVDDDSEETYKEKYKRLENENDTLKETIKRLELENVELQKKRRFFNDFI